MEEKKIKGGGWVGGPAAALVKIILSGDALKLANELELKHFTVNKTRECLPIYTLEEKRKAYIPAPIEYREWYNKNDITQSNVNVFTCFTNYSFEELEPPFCRQKETGRVQCFGPPHLSVPTNKRKA